MSGGSNVEHYQTKLVCTECGNEAFIWRRSVKRREHGHVKHMWCFVCREVTAHEEVRR